MTFFEDVKQKIRVWRRENRERAQEQKAERVDPPGVTVPAWLVRAAHFAGWVAYAALMYFLWERVLDVSEAQHSTLQVTHFGIWSNLDLALFFPLIVGYVFVVIGVPYVAKIAIPILVSLSWRDNFWPKLTSLIITVLVSVVLITGTATVGSNAIIESERDAAVAVEQVQQGRAVLEARIAARESELRSMMENRNAYLAQAASVGAAEWQRSYIDQTPASDPQRDRIVRALGAARAADQVRADISALREQLATSQSVAEVSSEVVTARTQTLNSVMDALNTFWVLMLAVVMDLACLFMPWIAMRLEQTRNAQLARATGVEGSGWADESHRIEDLREEEPVVPQPMKPAREVVTDAETGEEMIKITPKPHWRKAKGKKQKLDIQPDVPPDETGVTNDGGNRTASLVARDRDGQEHRNEERGNDEGISQHDHGVGVIAGGPAQKEETAEHGGDDRGSNAGADDVLSQPDPSTELAPMSDEELLTLPEFADEAPVDATNADPEQGAGADDDSQSDHAERTEPETDERRMIAAE